MHYTGMPLNDKSEQIDSAEGTAKSKLFLRLQTHNNELFLDKR